VLEINLELIIFTILAAFMLGGSIAMVTNKQTVFAAFGFLVAMIGLAGIFALLDNRFLAIAQIMVSVGAVVVLSMLTILTINMRNKTLPVEPDKFKWIAFTTLLVTPFTYLLYKSLTSFPQEFPVTLKIIDSKAIGHELFTSWVLPFEIVSILLLVGMLGSIVIARKKKEQK